MGELEGWVQTLNGLGARLFVLLAIERHMPLLDVARALDGRGYRRHLESFVDAWWAEMVEDVVISKEQSEAHERFALQLIIENESGVPHHGRVTAGAVLEIVYRFAMARDAGGDPSSSDLVRVLGHLRALGQVLAADAEPETYVRDLVTLASSSVPTQAQATRDRMRAEAERLWPPETVAALRDRLEV